MANVINGSKGLNITNIEQLPAGLRCNFLIAINGRNGSLIAKQWKRKASKLQENETVITFTKTAYNQAVKLNA